MNSVLLKPGTVKLCSLREVEQAEYAVAAGADMFGLVFAEARRRVAMETAKEIVREVRALAGPAEVRSVGVFVSQPPDDINRIADEVGLDIVQLHGGEPPAYASLIERPVIYAIRSQPGAAMSDIDGRLAQMPSDRFVAALVDGYHAGLPGGSGAVADWSLAAEAATRYPVILAGGLTPESVAQAIHKVRPLGVDVSSGVEVDGRKSRDRMIEFVREARLAFASNPAVAQSEISI